MRPIAIVVALSACAHNVRQDGATGADGTIKGAVPIALDNNAGEAKGIVTYPGGDRIDWKSIQLPEGKHGTLALKLTYSTPRPGLHVAFDVFDQWHTPVAKAVYQKTSHARETTIANAKGTYFVRVYAPKRGDAGRYKIAADFVEQTDGGKGPDWPNIPVADPPKLADIPQDAPGTGPDAVCDPFDTKNKACRDHCAWDAQPNWPGCAKECPDATIPDNAKFPACARIMKCAAVKDPRIDACNVAAPPPPPAPPVIARVIKKSMEGGVLHVWIGVGTSSGVDKGWTVGHVMRGDSGKFLSGGGATIVKINKTTTELTVSNLNIDTLTANDQIEVGAQ